MSKDDKNLSTGFDLSTFDPDKMPDFTKMSSEESLAYFKKVAAHRAANPRSEEERRAAAKKAMETFDRIGRQMRDNGMTQELLIEILYEDATSEERKEIIRDLYGEDDD